MGDLASMEDRVKILEAEALEHERHDDERFLGLREGLSKVQVELANLARTISDALSGSDERAGLRERVRKLEDIERDRKWALRVLGAAVIGQAVVMLFRVFGGKMPV